jgi:hypothetical protein
VSQTAAARCHLWTVALAGLLAGGLVCELLHGTPTARPARTTADSLRARAPQVQVLPVWRTRTPSQTYSPEMVVDFQLEALRHVPRSFEDGEPFQALDVVHRFASQANRRSTGPLLRFGAILSGPSYAPLLGARGAELQEIAVHENGFARVDVEVLARDGSQVPYVFYLSREVEGRYQGCWVTDGVLRGPGGEGPPASWMGGR